MNHKLFPRLDTINIYVTGRRYMLLCRHGVPMMFVTNPVVPDVHLRLVLFHCITDNHKGL
jgi:hypothetical protein